MGYAEGYQKEIHRNQSIKIMKKLPLLFVFLPVLLLGQEQNTKLAEKLLLKVESGANALPGDTIMGGTPTSGVTYKMGNVGASSDFSASGAGTTANGVVFKADGDAPGAWDGAILRPINQYALTTPDPSYNLTVSGAVPTYGHKGNNSYWEFDGVDDLTTYAFTTATSSVVLWVYPTVTNKLWVNMGTNMTIGIDGSNDLSLGSEFTNPTTYVNGTASNAVTLNAWNYIVINSDEITPTTLQFGYVSSSYGAFKLKGFMAFNYALDATGVTYYSNPANHPKVVDQTATNAWVEVAPTLGAETYIFSLAVFNNKLYGGTYPNGKLYEWNGTNAWVEVAPKLGAETYIYSLAVFNNKLYGGTGENGKLYEWNGTNAWVEVAPKLGAETYILSLAVFNNKLYGGTYPNGKLYEWNGTNAWVEVAPTLGAETNIRSLAVFNNKLYGGTIPNGKLYEWNGTNAWVEVAPTLGAEIYIMSLAVFNNKLYGGTIPNGKLYEWNGSNAWVEVAPTLGAETRIFSLAVFNNKLYGGTAENGKLYEWNGTNAWVEVAPKLGTETHIWSLAVFNNKLYGGTIPNGKLYEWNGSISTFFLSPEGMYPGLWRDAYHSIDVSVGTGSTSPRLVKSQSGMNAWRFDGTSSCLSLADAKAPQLNGDVTISFWAMPTKLINYALLVYNGKLFCYSLAGGIFWFFRDGNADSKLITDEIFTINTWSHVVITSSSIGYTSVYLNGSLISSGTSGTPAEGSVDLRIGRLSGGTYPFQGVIEGLKIYKRLWSAEEISLGYSLYDD